MSNGDIGKQPKGGFIPGEVKIRVHDRPPSLLLPKEVCIRQVENGFIVIIGCKTFVEKEWEEVAVELEAYWNDPEKTYRKHCKDSH